MGVGSGLVGEHFSEVSNGSTTKKKSSKSPKALLTRGWKGGQRVERMPWGLRFLGGWVGWLALHTITHTPLSAICLPCCCMHIHPLIITYC